MTDHNAASPTAILTNGQIDALVSALPDCKSPHRRALLPRILEEWSQIDLNEHLSTPSTEQVRAEQEQLQKVANSAAQLAEAISGLDLTPRFAVARELLQPSSNTLTVGPSFLPAKRMDRILENAPVRLQLLAAAARQLANDWAPPQLRDAMLQRYLVLMDLAAIFQWATGQHAGRKIRTDASEDEGKPYGPFWEFARAAWSIIFGSERGLDYAMRIWAKGQTDFGGRSPLIENMRLRHPEWRGFCR